MYIDSKSKENWKIGLNTSEKGQMLKNTRKKALLELRYRELKMALVHCGLVLEGKGDSYNITTSKKPL